MFQNFLGDSLLNSSPLMQEFFQSKKDDLPKLTDGSTALDRQCRTIRTNIGQMAPESISVKIEPATNDNSVSSSIKSGKHGISVLTISGKEQDSTTGSFSEFSSTRTLPLYISENGLEEQIISKLVTDKLTGNRVLEITLPEEPVKMEAIEIPIQRQESQKGQENGNEGAVKSTQKFKSDIEIELKKPDLVKSLDVEQE